MPHPHPDHFNGLPYVVPEDVPAIRRHGAVPKVIEESSTAEREQWGPMYGDY
ncbi:hypothetical protein [Spirillospora sp. NPDC048819]|uniref:hypothetical protein n=1 Tax=Spirillospora sp. NPDC048819 TaxID=3155268 RepID=UPI0033F98F52